ncbi:MAG: peptide ABC transporter substrate-binding protein [Gammaproteobacteria bacterium]|jgi:oligopeptide transport system substrate-binding protein|nr:peptide ABC transporter substrate-binding protein [Gammaproteobacteria bacterium]MBT5203735.1 peptide ABC transporter substrate-binding protein [Gammaproteobacteria bacterium]MBT5601780.1 peptide ABC transporter substrate-binding protein [Gammaproteobacteria bacterium]MBT6244145.1 peptide ABC transporter substrate-binding protein [Gammaproteobacteria bacterium]
MNTILPFLFTVILLLHSHHCLAEAADFETQTVKLALNQEPPQLNGMKATDQVSVMVLGHIMEGLTRYDRRGRIIPGVAERWEVNDEEATFWLRPNAKWSNGETVTAHDFVFAWRTTLTPSTASEYAFILYAIKNAEAINQGKLAPEELGVEALDDFTLKVELERPTAYFSKLTAFVSYFPIQEKFYKSRLDRYAADASDLIFNGAFAMTDWVHSASIKLKKNPHYWNRDKIKLNAIEADYITADTRARLNLFIDNKIIFTRLDGETYQDALTRKFRIRSFSTGSVFFIEYNHRPDRITANLLLRQAIQAVYNADEFVNKVLATPGNLRGESLFPVWLDGTEEKFRTEYPAPRLEPDTDLGRRLLNQAKSQLGVTQLPPLVLLVGDSPTAAKQAEYLQGLLKSKLNLDIKIDIQTFKQRLAKMTSGDFDLVGAGWGPDFDDIMTFGDLFASWNLNNRGRYNNPDYDRFVRTAMNSSIPKVRMDAMAELQRIVHEDAVILPLYEQGVIYLLHPKVKGVVRNVVGSDPDFTYARVVQ